MTITILTLFPEIFKDIFSYSIIGRARKKGLVDIQLVNIRDFALDKHRTVDDKPYGGGVGMLLRVDVVERAITNVKCPTTSAGRQMSPNQTGPNIKCSEKVILLDPKAPLFSQTKARKYAKLDHLILVCGHYEGIDARICHFVDESVSIGRYILTGGEIPAMVITDSVVRLIPQVLAKKEAITDESFSKRGILEPPQFTRPHVYKGFEVPDVLLSGNHKQIHKWKEKKVKIKKLAY